MQAKRTNTSLTLAQPKPFVKWVGGKRQLLPELVARLPQQFGAYFEPFVGGGALFWLLQYQRALQVDFQTYISDFNSELINAYQVVRDQPTELIACLESFENNEEFYYRVRAWDRC